MVNYTIKFSVLLFQRLSVIFFFFWKGGGQGELHPVYINNIYASVGLFHV